MKAISPNNYLNHLNTRKRLRLYIFHLKIIMSIQKQSCGFIKFLFKGRFRHIRRQVLVLGKRAELLHVTIAVTLQESLFTMTTEFKLLLVLQHDRFICSNLMKVIPSKECN